MRTLQKTTLMLILLASCLTSHWSFGQVDFREETIYFLLTSRFFDGDPSNNAANEWSSYDPDPNVRPSITDPQDVTWRGDFKGLIQKLDYIQDLGFTAIWITPIVHNRSPLDYHGYHAWDFTKVDPRLESPGATFQDLINEVHARGMKIVLDIVTNHPGRFGIKDVAEIKYNTDPTQPWGQDANGNPLQPNPNWEYDGLTPNPDDGKTWSRANIPTMPAPYNQDLSAYNWPSTQSYVNTTDPDWYHHSGNGFAQGWDDTENLYNRALAGDTPDLNTASPLVRNYLIAAYTTFINMGVDAFRWDTMKHMSKEDVLAFKDAFHAVNPDLFIFGEVAQKRHELHNVEEINPHWYTWRGAVNASANSDIAVLDFYAEATFHGVFESGESFSNVMAAARYDHLYSDPSTLLTWLDNHDFGPNNDWNSRYGGSEENLAACMNFMFTWRGIPVVYYGTEIQFQKGVYADIHDATGIEKSIDETGRAYYGAEFANAPNHVIYQHIKKLNAIRRAVPALQKGDWRWGGNHPGNAVGYVRTYGNSEVAVGLAKDGAATFNFQNLTDGLYRDAVTGNEVQVSGGGLSFVVESGSAGIYVLNGPGMIGQNGAGYFQAGSGTFPVVSASPAGGHYSDPIQVSLSASSQNGNTTIYYTLDGSDPNTGSNVYTGPITVSTNTTLKAVAVDAQNQYSSIISQSYTIGEVAGLSIYFEKPAGWSTAHVHYWNLSPGGGSSTWPGPAMTSVGDGWYRYDFASAASINLVFNDNGGSQTTDLTRSADGWYDQSGTWHDTDPRVTVNQPPTVSITPQGGNYLDGEVVSVSLTATDDSDPDPSIYYTTDGSNPSTTSTLYSGNFDVTNDMVVKAIAVDDGELSSAVETATFDFEPAPSGLTVHFKPTGYTDPELYYWSVTPSGQATSWPGEQMIAEGDGWYQYTLNGASCANVIFSNNGGGQSPDLNRCSEGWYVDGVWYDNKPTGTPGLTIHFLKPANWSTARMHYWTVTPSSVANTNWPGVQMTQDGNGWWSYTIADATCANLLFNDNGGTQTADLSRCGEGWYDNGWSSSGSRTSPSLMNQHKEGVTLSQNYPNPVTEMTTIDLELKTTQNIRLAVYAMDGKEVLTIVQDEVRAGLHRYVLSAENFDPGIYFYRLEYKDHLLIRRMLVK